MKNLLAVCMAFGLAFSMLACGGKKSTSKSEMQTFTEQEFLQDYGEMENLERRLEDLGFKIKTRYDFNSHVTYYTWDVDHLNKEADGSTEFERINALEDYARYMRSFLKKYSGSFKLKKGGGEVEEMQMRETIKSEFEAKARLAETTIKRYRE